MELINGDPEHLRDRLTVEHLLAFARSVDPNARPISYQRNWWDGSTATGCLLVDIAGERRRVVSAGSGSPVLLPARRLRARQTLTSSRRAASEPLPAGSAEPSRHVSITSGPVTSRRRLGELAAELPGQAPLFSLEPAVEVPPLPPSTPSIERRTVVQDGDYTVCRYADCGGLLPLGYRAASGCPSCGRR